MKFEVGKYYHAEYCDYDGIDRCLDAVCTKRSAKMAWFYSGKTGFVHVKIHTDTVGNESARIYPAYFLYA